MYIRKFKNLNINIRAGDSIINNVQDFANDDDLFWNDLSIIISALDGWMYLYDANTNTLYWLNNYGWDHICDIIDGKSVKLHPMDDDDAREIIEEHYGE